MRRFLTPGRLAALLVLLAVLGWAWPLVPLWGSSSLGEAALDRQEPDAAHLMKMAPLALLSPQSVPVQDVGTERRVLARVGGRGKRLARNAYEGGLIADGWTLLERSGRRSRWQARADAMVNRAGDLLVLDCRRFSQAFEVCDADLRLFRPLPLP